MHLPAYLSDSLSFVDTVDCDPDTVRPVVSFRPRTRRRQFRLGCDRAFVAVLASYFWLLARSLKRFTGAWHRWLFVRLIAWISGIVAVKFLLTRHFNGFGFPSAPMYSANNF
jgi:hypothetical protein